VFRILLAGLLALVTLPACAQPMATLTVKVEKVTPGGNIRLALFTEQTYDDDKAKDVPDAVVPAKAGETIITLTDIKPGIYAIKLFQDSNSNGKFDLSLIGLPLESYGFSNDIRPFLTAPPFSRTKFEVRPGANTITIHLQ
jgi:uncharacterized protein (DUF2141 family)